MRILSTRPDRGVSITTPTPEIMAALSVGGYVERAARDWEIHKFVSHGLQESIAVRWIDALVEGGCSTQESYALIIDKDTKAEWSAKELVDMEDFLADRWFRNAWVRSQNGGPIYIDLERARVQQAQRLEELELKVRKPKFIRRRRTDYLTDWFENPHLPGWIEQAPTVQALRAIWPTELLGET